MAVHNSLIEGLVFVQCSRVSKNSARLLLKVKPMEDTGSTHPCDILVTIKYQMVKMSVIFESCTQVLTKVSINVSSPFLGYGVICGNRNV